MTAPKVSTSEAFTLLQTVLGATLIEVRERVTGKVIWTRSESSACETKPGIVES